MKFGKHIQKRQLDIPEYAASFVDYKALKKLIKKLSATPILNAREKGDHLSDPQASLQANKATFFFRLERELEKVNIFYLQKEAELKLRLKTLLDRKQGLQSRAAPTSKLSSNYVALDEGFRLFSNDLDKLQQFVEVNQTAFSKILKKWDKTSKSRTKELYLSRAVEVQPCFNRDVISDLSDQATSGLLELQAWAEGEKITYTPAVELQHRPQSAAQDDSEPDAQIVQAINTGNANLVREWVSRLPANDEGRERVSRIFLTTFHSASPTAQRALCETGTVDFNFTDPINERNSLHEAAIYGNEEMLNVALANGGNIREPDVYGRLPIHYASMHGRVNMLLTLAQMAQDTVDARDLDGFTPLIHGIVHAHPRTVERMLDLGAQVNPTGSGNHIPLNLACQYGSPAIIEQMLRYSPQILPDAEGLFPQHLVARFGQSPNILGMLRAYGADMNQADKLYQWTPLFHAASEGHLHCLQQLLQFGVNESVADEKDLTAMFYAAWEGNLRCMQLLVEASQTQRANLRDVQMAAAEPPPSSGLTSSSQADPETIPSLMLPPPIIPLRRYGHNFLDTSRTFILLSFDGLGAEPVEFYGDSKYPAARLTISSKSSDLIPRNLPLPIQDDLKTISFQIENLDKFSIDFDIFPTFGSKVIARTAASSRSFDTRNSSSGRWHLELFDPRLRAIGRISFRYQVITPFQGIPLEVTHFATYWKATTQDDNQASTLITGSSLSGNFLRLFIQVTNDGVPVLYPDWALPNSRHDLISRLTYGEFASAASSVGKGREMLQDLIESGMDSSNLSRAQKQIARSRASLSDLLALLPAEINLELHVCYPGREEETARQLAPTQNINFVIDSILNVVFEHARHLREENSAALRNFVFSSYNQDVCMALNWKQPNFPVLLCNDLGSADSIASRSLTSESASDDVVTNCGRTAMSIKEAVRVAQSNNFMGLVCNSRLLDLVPALIPSVKEAGLVLIADYSQHGNSAAAGGGRRQAERAAAPRVLDLREGVDGLLADNAVLKFKDSIDQ